MNNKLQQLIEYEEFGLAAAEYFNFKWVYNLSKYFSSINPNKIDTSDFDQFPKYNEYQLGVLTDEIEKNKTLVEMVDPNFIEKADKIISEFLAEKPLVSLTRYFGNVIGIEAWKIEVRSGRRHLQHLEVQETYKEKARSAIPEEEAERIDSLALPILQKLEKDLNENYRNLFNDVVDDMEIPDQIYARLQEVSHPDFSIEEINT